MGVKTQGTELFFIYNSLSVKLLCPTGVTGLGGATDQIDTTCLGDSERTYVSGLANPGTVSVPFNFEPSAVSQQNLFTLKETGAITNWIICLSDGTAQPTVLTGNFVAPTGRTSAKFTAYVSDVNIDVSTNEIVRGTLTLQRSGAVAWTFKTV